MAKVNFTKVESALAEGMRRISVEHLLDIADKKDSGNKESLRLGETPALESLDDEVKKNKKRLIAVIGLRLQLKRLASKDKDIYKKAGISRKLLRLLAEGEEPISDKKWKMIQKVKKTSEELKEQLLQGKDSDMDKKIEDAREETINTRFNVRKGWLPLH